MIGPGQYLSRPLLQHHHCHNNISLRFMVHSVLLLNLSCSSQPLHFLTISNDCIRIVFCHSSDGSYYPVIYHNNFWIQSKQMIEMNASLTHLPLSLSYASIASWLVTPNLINSFKMTRTYTILIIANHIPNAIIF